jgi:PAS domain S-box-containing protein
VRWFIVAALLLIVVLACGAQWISSEYGRGQVARAMLSRSYDRRIVISDLMSHLKDMETDGRSYRTTGDPLFLLSYRFAAAAIDEQQQRLERLLINVPLQSARYRELHGIIGRRKDVLDAGLQARAPDAKPAARDRSDERLGDDAMEQARMLANAMMMEEDRMIADRSRRWNERSVTARRNVWWAAAAFFGTIAAVLIAVLNGRRAQFRLAVEMQKTAARLNGVFLGTHDAIALIDAQGRIEAVNPAVTRMLGHTPAKLIGRDIASLIDVLPQTGTLAERIGLAHGAIAEPLRIDRCAYHADGHSVPVDVVLGLMPMPRRLHVVAAIRDVSERKAIDRMKDEFIATASHELRTPLTSVVGALGLLRTSSGAILPDAARRLVAVAEENSRRLIDLVNDLLDIEKMGSAGPRGRTMPIDLGPILQRAARGSEGLAAGRGVAISVAIPPGGLPVHGDAGELTRVVTNLLANAIRFSPDGGVVTVKADRHEGWAVVTTVEDQGPGVPPAFREQLFARFAQSEERRSTGGTGLGLAISRQIIQAHGGAIWFEPRPGGGARFRFSIDLRRTDPPPPRLLLVAAAAEAMPVLRAIADHGGCDAERATTLADALAGGGLADAAGGARREHYDAMLVDPGADGPAESAALATLLAVRKDMPTFILRDGRLSVANGADGDGWDAIGDGEGELATMVRTMTQRGAERA